MKKSKRYIKSGTSNFGSNDNIFGYSFPLVTYIAENYMYDEETDTETEERDYDADQWEYEDAMSEAEDLAYEMGVDFRVNNPDNYVDSDNVDEPFAVTIRSGYYDGIYIKVLEGHDSWWDVEDEEEVPYDEIQMNDFADKINAYLDKLCSEYGWQKLGVTARFDNGETWYSKIDSAKKSKKSKKEKSADERAKDEGADITCARKPVKSGMSYEQALNEFTSTGKPWGDYWSMQSDWMAYIDSLEKDGLVDYEESKNWDNPCTPETFKEWITSSVKPVKSGYYDDPENHPDGGGTCDYCGGEVMPGDGYEPDFESSFDEARSWLYVYLSADPENADHMDAPQSDWEFAHWLGGDWTDDDVRDMEQEVIEIAFDNGDYMCPSCHKEKIKEAAKKYVDDNFGDDDDDEIESSCKKLTSGQKRNRESLKSIIGSDINQNKEIKSSRKSVKSSINNSDTEQTLEALANRYFPLNDNHTRTCYFINKNGEWFLKLNSAYDFRKSPDIGGKIEINGDGSITVSGYKTYGEVVISPDCDYARRNIVLRPVSVTITKDELEAVKNKDYGDRSYGSINPYDEFYNKIRDFFRG